MNVIPGVQYTFTILDGPRTYDLLVLSIDGGVAETMRHGGGLHGQRVWKEIAEFSQAVGVYDRRNTDHENNQYGPRKSAQALADETGCDVSLVQG